MSCCPNDLEDHSRLLKKMLLGHTSALL